MGKWHTLTLINTEYDQGTELLLPFELGEGVYFGKSPDWLNRIVGTDELSYSQREKIKKSKYSFYSEYNADSLGSIQKEKLERIRLANLALWIAKPSKIGSDLFLHIKSDNEDKLLVNGASTPFLIPHEKDGNGLLGADDFNLAKNINSKIQTLERHNSLWVVIYTLWQAFLSDKSWEIRFLLLWIAIESLFGAETEIMYRISQRISFFISTDEKSERLKSYQVAKKSYGWRSQVVHGMKLSKLGLEESAAILYDTELIIRKALIKILKDDKLIEVFGNDKNREKYLDELVFN